MYQLRVRPDWLMASPSRKAHCTTNSSFTHCAYTSQLSSNRWNCRSAFSRAAASPCRWYTSSARSQYIRRSMQRGWETRSYRSPAQKIWLHQSMARSVEKSNSWPDANSFPSATRAGVFFQSCSAVDAAPQGIGG